MSPVVAIVASELVRNPVVKRSDDRSGAGAFVRPVDQTASAGAGESRTTEKSPTPSGQTTESLGG